MATKFSEPFVQKKRLVHSVPRGNSSVPHAPSGNTRGRADHGTVPAWLSVAAFAAAGLLSGPSAGAAPPPGPQTVETAWHLIVAGEPEAAYALLRRAIQDAPEGADTSALRYTAAQALLAGGHLAQAAQLLGPLAEERPDLHHARLDYAAVLFDLGRDDEADAVFRQVRRAEGLPKATKRAVEGFLARIRARQRWRLDFDTGLWRDDNVNNAPERDTVAIPAFGGLRFTLDQKPVRAWVARAGARLRWREALNERLSLETDASLARNTALRASAHNRSWAGLSTGPRLHYALDVGGRPRPGLFSASLGVERRWRGGEGYAKGLWAGLGLEQAVARDWRLGAFPRVWTTRYDRARDAKPWGRSLALYASRRAGPGWLTAGAKAARETAEARALRWRSREASLRYTADVGQDWRVEARTTLVRTRFDAEEWLFRTRRRDRTVEAGLTLSHRALAWEGYLPELILDWSRTRSTIPLYDRETRTLRVGVRRLF